MQRPKTTQSVTEGSQSTQATLVITKPGKGLGVVVMDKTEFVRLLRNASVVDTSKFIPVSSERPKRRGCLPKQYHPLLEKEYGKYSQSQ